MHKTAMLLNPTIKSPIPGERKSQAATQTIESTHHVKAKQTKGTMYLIDKNAKSVKSFVASCQSLRELVYDYSFPWGDTGLRLSTVKAYPVLCRHWDAGEKRVRDAAENFFADYPALQQAAQNGDLGSLYDATQYPSITQLRKIFKVSLEVWPLPDSGHFVADIAQEAAETAKANMEQVYKDSLVNSFKIMADKSEKLVSKFIEKCESYGRDKNGKMNGIFRDTLITNISEQAELIRNLNFTNEAGIETLANQLDRLAKCTGMTLRDDDNYRAQKLGEAKTLMAKLDSFRQVDTSVNNLIGSVADYY